MKENILVVLSLSSQRHSSLQPSCLALTQGIAVLSTPFRHLRLFDLSHVGASPGSNANFRFLDRGHCPNVLPATLVSLETFFSLGPNFHFICGAVPPLETVIPALSLVSHKNDRLKAKSCPVVSNAFPIFPPDYCSALDVVQHPLWKWHKSRTQCSHAFPKHAIKTQMNIVIPRCRNTSIPESTVGTSNKTTVHKNSGF